MYVEGVDVGVGPEHAYESDTERLPQNLLKPHGLGKGVMEERLHPLLFIQFGNEPTPAFWVFDIGYLETADVRQDGPKAVPGVDKDGGSLGDLQEVCAQVCQQQDDGDDEWHGFFLNCSNAAGTTARHVQVFVDRLFEIDFTSDRKEVQSGENIRLQWELRQ